MDLNVYLSSIHLLSVEAGGSQIVALRKEVEQRSRLLSQLRLQKTTTERVRDTDGELSTCVMCLLSQELRDTQSAAEDHLKQTKAEVC